MPMIEEIHLAVGGSVLSPASGSLGGRVVRTSDLRFTVVGSPPSHHTAWLLDRPTYTSADLYFTGILSFFFLYFFTTYPLSSLNGTQPKSVTWSEVSAIWKRMSKIWSIPYPYQSGTQKTHIFGRLRNSTATLTAHIFQTKHDIDNRSESALTTTRDLLHRLKTTWTLVHKRLQIGGEFSHTIRKISIPQHWEALQTEISKRNSSTVHTLPNGGR